MAVYLVSTKFQLFISHEYNKIRISPAQAMVKQWLTNFRMTGPIECTSLITRIASNMGIVDGNPVPFIEEPRVMIDEAYLVQGHMLKKARMTP